MPYQRPPPRGMSMRPYVSVTYNCSAPEYIARRMKIRLWASLIKVEYWTVEAHNYHPSQRPRLLVQHHNELRALIREGARIQLDWYDDYSGWQLPDAFDWEQDWKDGRYNDQEGAEYFSAEELNLGRIPPMSALESSRQHYSRATPDPPSDIWETASSTNTEQTVCPAAAAGDDDAEMTDVEDEELEQQDTANQVYDSDLDTEMTDVESGTGTDLDSDYAPSERLPPVVSNPRTRLAARRERQQQSILPSRLTPRSTLWVAQSSITRSIPTRPHPSLNPTRQSGDPLTGERPDFIHGERVHGADQQADRSSEADDERSDTSDTSDRTVREQDFRPLTRPTTGQLRLRRASTASSTTNIRSRSGSILSTDAEGSLVTDIRDAEAGGSASVDIHTPGPAQDAAVQLFLPDDLPQRLPPLEEYELAEGDIIPLFWAPDHPHRLRPRNGNFGSNRVPPDVPFPVQALPGTLSTKQHCDRAAAALGIISQSKRPPAVAIPMRSDRGAHASVTTGSGVFESTACSSHNGDTVTSSGSDCSDYRLRLHQLGPRIHNNATVTGMEDCGMFAYPGPRGDSQTAWAARDIWMRTLKEEWESALDPARDRNLYISLWRMEVDAARGHGTAGADMIRSSVHEDVASFWEGNDNFFTGSAAAGGTADDYHVISDAIERAGHGFLEPILQAGKEQIQLDREARDDISVDPEVDVDEGWWRPEEGTRRLIVENDWCRSLPRDYKN